ncbi:hypothetical protein [Streptomyces sp. NL15-2K]|nr:MULTISPECIES: hypothetical protein [Actinomycetes]WKX07399.1 hypothetical protein Q4V64_07825 [Kutzneria buriramensis]GCB51368.1 hypothetical protein SNL152K_8724 [Streptomyces sp. NL15-2K]
MSEARVDEAWDTLHPLLPPTPHKAMVDVVGREGPPDLRHSA